MGIGAVDWEREWDRERDESGGHLHTSTFSPVHPLPPPMPPPPPPPAAAAADQAINQECNHKHQCYTCWPDSGCQPLDDYQRLVVGEHGRVEGAAAMRAEIFARGPISCGIDATEGLDKYTGAAVWRGVCVAAREGECVSFACADTAGHCGRKVG